MQPHLILNRERRVWVKVHQLLNPNNSKRARRSHASALLRAVKIHVKSRSITKKTILWSTSRSIPSTKLSKRLITSSVSCSRVWTSLLTHKKQMEERPSWPLKSRLETSSLTWFYFLPLMSHSSSSNCTSRPHYNSIKMRNKGFKRYKGSLQNGSISTYPWRNWSRALLIVNTFNSETSFSY